MFPIGDPRGRIVAFGARALQADAKPKYLNTGETTLFSKGHLLYNFASARAAAIKAGTIIVAEGYMDVIALVRAGFEASVAPLGTALTEQQLALLWRMAPEPILAFDGDEAGEGGQVQLRGLGRPRQVGHHQDRVAPQQLRRLNLPLHNPYRFRPHPRRTTGAPGTPPVVTVPTGIVPAPRAGCPLETNDRSLMPGEHSRL